MNILLDIGNTRIKWGVDENGVVNAGSPVAHQNNDFLQAIEGFWREISVPVILAICSVSHQKIVLQLIDLAKDLWPKIEVIIAKSSRTSYAVSSAYRKPETLGVDRWLGMIALQHYYAGNSCVVDCGTAITIDCLDQQGMHKGGLISPGLQLMKQSLFKGANDINSFDQSYAVGLSDSTESAIYSGVLYAAVGLVEKTMKLMSCCQTLVLTGGDAELLAKYLALDCIVEPNLVLKGLSLYCKEEKQQ